MESSKKKIYIKAVANTFFRMRLQSKKSLNDVAYEIGVEYPYYWKIEKGQKPCSSHRLIEIAYVLGMTLPEFAFELEKEIHDLEKQEKINQINKVLD